MNSGVWLGDAVRVLARLRADPETARRALVLLGLRDPAAASAIPPEDEVRHQRPAGVRAVPPDRPAPTPPTVRELLHGRPPADPAEPVETPLVERVPPDRRRAAAAPRHLPSLADVLSTPPAGPAAQPPGPPQPGSPMPPGPLPPSLLPPAQQRAILSTLCRSPAATGDVDVDELVDLIARREPVRRLPLTTIPTTRRGVQVLVDFGDGMRPFVGDQREVVRALERLAGPDGFEVLRFAGTPLDPPGAGPGPAWTWRPYRPPLAGQPVIVLSDAGAGTAHPDRRGVQERWMAFATLLRAAGSQVVVLAPVPADRFPAALRTALPILTWDRTTRVADAVEAARRSAGRVQGRSR